MIYSTGESDNVSSHDRGYTPTGSSITHRINYVNNSECALIKYIIVIPDKYSPRRVGEIFGLGNKLWN